MRISRTWLLSLGFVAACKSDLERLRMGERDLHGANLQHVSLTGLDLHGANLRDADLRGSDLAGCNLEWVDLSGADLRGTHLDVGVLHTGYNEMVFINHYIKCDANTRWDVPFRTHFSCATGQLSVTFDPVAPPPPPPPETFHPVTRDTMVLTCRDWQGRSINLTAPTGSTCLSRGFNSHKNPRR